jgi:hypothetical protein
MKLQFQKNFDFTKLLEVGKVFNYLALGLRWYSTHDSMTTKADDKKFGISGNDSSF